jgi:hypothetical protein
LNAEHYQTLERQFGELHPLTVASTSAVPAASEAVIRSPRSSTDETIPIRGAGA